MSASIYSCQDCASCLADRSGAVLAETKSTAYGDLGAKALPERLSRSWRLVRRSVAPSTDRKHSPGSVRAVMIPGNNLGKMSENGDLDIDF